MRRHRLRRLQARACPAPGAPTPPPRRASPPPGRLVFCFVSSFRAVSTSRAIARAVSTNLASSAPARSVTPPTRAAAANASPATTARRPGLAAITSPPTPPRRLQIAAAPSPRRAISGAPGMRLEEPLAVPRSRKRENPAVAKRGGERVISGSRARRARPRREYPPTPRWTPRPRNTSVCRRRAKRHARAERISNRAAGAGPFFPPRSSSSRDESRDGRPRRLRSNPLPGRRRTRCRRAPEDPPRRFVFRFPRGPRRRRSNPPPRP